MNLVRVRDPLNRNVETYYLDGAARVTNVVNIEGQSLAISYAVGSTVKSLQRFDGSRVDLDYNGEGNLSQVVWSPAAGSGQAGLTNRYAYLRNGLLLTASNETCVIANAYDGANRLTLTQVSGFILQPSSVAYTYYPAGNVSNLLSVAGTNTYTYDPAERLSALSAFRPGLSPLHFALTYDPHRGLISGVTCENSGVTNAYGYDCMDRWTNIVWRDKAAKVLASFTYGYHAAGMITQQLATINDSPITNHYTYDSLDRLLAVTTFTGAVPAVVTYAYDLAGNRTQMVANGVTVSYTLGVGDRLVSWGTNGENSVAYDAAGNVTNMAFGDGRTVALVWNGRYQLTEVRTNGVAVERYGYDALGRRVFCSVRSASGAWTTNYFLYDGPHVIADLDSTGGLIRAYVYGPGMDNLLAMTVHTGATPASYFYIKDHLGTVHALVDAEGTVVEAYCYDPWGRTTVYDGNGNLLSESAIGNRYGFQGREISWRTGLYYFRARWPCPSVASGEGGYDPVTGRWLSNDPIGISGGLNQYVFAVNHPIEIADPSGLFTVAVGAGANGNLLLGHGEVSSQATLSINGWNPLDWRLGHADTLGGGVGAGLGGAIGAVFSVSSAECPEQWNGRSTTLGGSGGTPVVIGIDVGNLDLPAIGSRIDNPQSGVAVPPLKVDVFAGLGLPTLPPWPPAEFHMDATLTCASSKPIREILSDLVKRIRRLF